jgi:hypothetical protein
LTAIGAQAFKADAGSKTLGDGVTFSLMVILRLS